VVLSAGNTLNVAGTLVVSGTLSVSTGVVSVTNTGVISGNAAGITLYGAGGSVTNLGKISGGVGIAVTGTAASGHTIINAGTIIGTGGTAVSFGTGTNRLIDDPGAEFTGDINGGNSASAVLELASAASRGTISDFNGATITNFATLQFDTGAAWTVSRTSAASGLGSIDITGFAANDTIDLIGFVVATDTFGSNVVTFANSGASQHATLHLAGTFSGSTLQFGTDGAGGTDIFLGNAPLLYGATLDETGIVAVSETVASGVMTLFNSGTTAVGTIVVGTSLSTGDFTLKAVGTTATDVIVSSVFGTYASGVTLLTNPTTITATAAVGNTANNVAAVNGPNGTAWTVTNFGTITETGGNSIGIELNAGGTAVNAGTISGSLAVGISVTGTGSVTNLSTGTISSLSVMTLAFGLPAPATSRTTARYWELKVSSATDRSPLRTLASS
jgi:fibronectin-binding autotransporter adhesin